VDGFLSVCQSAKSFACIVMNKRKRHFYTYGPLTPLFLHGRYL
jgi:hypothetical protein